MLECRPQTAAESNPKIFDVLVVTSVERAVQSRPRHFDNVTARLARTGQKMADKFAEEKEARAFGWVALGILGFLPAAGLVFLVVASYELLHGRTYWIGWVTASAILTLSVFVWLAGRYIGWKFIKRRARRHVNP